MVRRVTGAQEFMPVRYYVAAVAVLGAAALLVSLSTIHLELIDPLMLAILLGLAALTQRLPVFLFRSSAISVNTGRRCVSATRPRRMASTWT